MQTNYYCWSMQTMLASSQNTEGEQELLGFQCFSLQAINWIYCRKIWMRSCMFGTASLADGKGEYPPPPNLFISLRNNYHFVQMELPRGAIIFLDWILYWHMKWINIFVSELECIKFHYSINKMKEAVHLVQSPRGKNSNHHEMLHT